MRWENLTAFDALQKLLRERGLMLEPTENAEWLVKKRLPQASVILEDFRKYEAEFKELHEALQRPFARFDVDYKGMFEGDVARIDYFNPQELARSLSLHSSASLALKDRRNALQSVSSALALAKLYEADPRFSGGLNSGFIARSAIQPVWEGLASRQWIETDLRELEEQLRSIDLMSQMAVGLRAERASILYAITNHSRRQLSTNFIAEWFFPLSLMDHIQRLVVRSCPRGWLYQNAVVSARSIQDTLDSMDLKAQRFSVPRLNAATNTFTTVFPPFRYLVIDFSWAVKSIVRNQIGVNQAIIACVLERYRLAEGVYPENLEDMVPRFAEKLPADLISGQPMKYRRESKDRFILYSIGFDEKDDGGAFPAAHSGPGDWIWRYP